MSKENEVRDFGTGAIRDGNCAGGAIINNGYKGRMDLLPWNAIEAVSVHSQYGAIQYGERNVDSGIPVSNLMDSCIRHSSEILRGYTNEDDKLPLWHYRAAAWNALWALEMAITRPDMVDVPYVIETSQADVETSHYQSDHDASGCRPGGPGEFVAAAVVRTDSDREKPVWSRLLNLFNRSKRKN